MNALKHLFCAGLIASSLSVISASQAGPYSWEPDSPPPAAEPLNEYGVAPVVWHSPQPLVYHGVPATLQASPNFTFNHSRLNSAAQAELDGLMNRLHGPNPNYGLGHSGIAQSVSVEGHTDSIGSRRYNQRLSERRAQTTADYLTLQGIPLGLIGTSGAGELYPVASNRSADGRAQNRRADVTINALVVP